MAPVVHQTLHLYAFVDIHKDETMCVSDFKEIFICTYPDLLKHQQLATITLHLYAFVGV